MSFRQALETSQLANLDLGNIAYIPFDRVNMTVACGAFVFIV